MRSWIKSFRLEIVVFILYVLLRLPHMGHDNFNTDVWRWKARTYNFGNAVFTGNFKDTIQVYHPGVTLMWVGSAGVKAYNLYLDATAQGQQPVELEAIFGLDVAQKLFVTLVIGLTLSSIFFVLRNLFGLKYASISVALIALEPFFMALSRVIHLEGLMSIFLVASFVWFYFYLQTTRTKHLFMASFFSALAVLTKSSALFILPFILLMAGTHYLFKPKFIKPYLLYLLGVVAFFFILWPGMWAAPGEALKAYSNGIFAVGVEGGHEQFYFGQYTLDPGATFYPIVLLFRSSIYVLIGLFGYLFIFKNISDQKLKTFTLYALLFCLFYFLEVTIPTKKLDRYLLPSIISACFLSSTFFIWLIDRIKVSQDKFRYLPYVFLFVPAVITAIVLHPDYLSFYNPLVGGLRKGVGVIEPKWIIGVPEIKEYFAAKMESGEVLPFYEGQSLIKLLHKDELDTKLTVAFPEKYYSQVWPFIKEMGGWAIVDALASEAEHAYYFVYPVWEDRSSFKDEYNLEFEGTIKVRGVDVYNVYKRQQ